MRYTTFYKNLALLSQIISNYLNLSKIAYFEDLVLFDSKRITLYINRYVIVLDPVPIDGHDLTPEKHRNHLIGMCSIYWGYSDCRRWGDND